MLPVAWSPEAEADLLDLVDFIAQRSQRAALNLGLAIKESTWPLSEHPMLFKRSNRIIGCREIVVQPNYIVLYQVQQARVLIVSVTHASRDYP